MQPSNLVLPLSCGLAIFSVKNFLDTQSFFPKYMVTVMQQIFIIPLVCSVRRVIKWRQYCYTYYLKTAWCTITVSFQLSQNPMEKVCEVCGKPTECRCSKCKQKYYCSRSCQVVDWNARHKRECKKLRQLQKSYSHSEVTNCLEKQKFIAILKQTIHLDGNVIEHVGAIVFQYLTGFLKTWRINQDQTNPSNINADFYRWTHQFHCHIDRDFQGIYPSSDTLFNWEDLGLDQQFEKANINGLHSFKIEIQPPPRLSGAATYTILSFSSHF